MPDWFYRTVAQPALFALPEKTGRNLALGIIGTLGRSRPGRAVIEFMGHMAPDPASAVTVDGVRFPSRVGIGRRVDPDRKATRALAGFGVGFIELPEGEPCEVSRDENRALLDGAARPAANHARPDIPCPVLTYRKSPDGAETVTLPSGKTLPVVAWDASPVSGDTGDGVVLQVGERTRDGWRVPADMPAGLPEAVRARRAAGPTGIIIVSGGISGPAEALALRDAGADLMIIDAGLVFNGPGLVKRCNEALLAEPVGRSHRDRRREQDVELSTPPGAARPVGETFLESTSPGHGGVGDTALPQGTSTPDVSLFRRDWFWGCLLGASFTLGGFATLLLAYTRVLLPYDEHYLGTTTGMVKLTQPKLFDFMAHDRATLGGVMTGLGLFFFILSRHAMRRGVHGSRTVFIAACLIGFSTFFSFFGFGYFDTLHAFVSVLLMQMTIQVLTGSGATADSTPRRIDIEDVAWRRAQWGQLLWVVHAVGLLIAGAIILGIGMTSVFVHEDIEFLCISPERLRALGEKFIAVIAHDRATTGGMLVSSGVAMLLATLWCHRRGAAWLWTAILLLGTPAYLGTIGVHFQVGYTDWRHLLPAFAGMALWLGGLALSHTYLRKGVARR